jgi:hypothetical protein
MHSSSYSSHSSSFGASGSAYASSGSSYGHQQAGGYSAQVSRGGHQQQQQQHGAYRSQIAEQVINAQQPVNIQATEQFSHGNYRGLYLNKQEVDAFRGPMPIEQYKINDDPNPEVVKKRLDKVKYTQEVAVRYLQPPLPPKPGNIIIRERQSTIPPAPPVVLRQEGQGATTPAPLVFRERPPKAPVCIPEQVVEVDGDAIPPPARRVVVEKLSNLPPKPQNVILEKWLPYQKQKRRVVFEPAQGQQAENPRNLIIEWEAPEVEVEKVCKDLGVVNADPEEYIRQYGNELKDACDMPALCCEIKPTNLPQPAPAKPCGQPEQRCGPAPVQRQPTPRQPTPQQSCGPRQSTPAPQRQPTPAQTGCGDCKSGSQSRAGSALPELEGDVQALRLVNLEANGLAQYRGKF